MSDISRVLLQFIFRVTFGVALSMAITPPRLVTSGYYRVHLWVLLGLNTFAALIAYTGRDSLAQVVASPGWLVGFSIFLAIASYAGGVAWLYEQPKWGGRFLYLITVGAILAAFLASPWSKLTGSVGLALALLDLVSGGLLLGSTLAAMFLGHWYLNTPGMQLLPLKRLVLLMGAAILARTISSGTGLGLQVAAGATLPFEFWAFISLRWLSGLLGALAMAWLTWETLKVPNTQSATGLLYAGVILSFIGELTSQLLTVGALYPL